MKKWIIILLSSISALAVTAADLDFNEAGRIAIQTGGRKKPMDTFAAETLQIIYGRRALKDPETGGRMSAMDAIFSMWLGGRQWENLPVILVSDTALRSELGLPGNQRHFSFEDLRANPKIRAFQESIQAREARGEKVEGLDKEAEIVLGRMGYLNYVLSGEAFTIVPNPESDTANWVALREVTKYHGEQTGRKLEGLRKSLADAYRSGDAVAFTAASVDLREALASLTPEFYPSEKSIGREVHYNQFHPFRWAWILYLAGMIALVLPRARVIGLAAFAGGLAIHSYGFYLRGMIGGYAPFSNMYETVVWVSLSIMAFALIFHYCYRSSIYLLSAAPLAVLALILADMLPTVLNPNINPLPPVLRDNFWLTTHVVTILLGYAAFAVAMALGHVILAYSLVRPGQVDRKTDWHQYLYRMFQLGILFLAAGTILGGVWANYSWGRFWGWDPKETWALIALLLYIFALHGRIAGWWGKFGLAVAGAICFHGILMAWYGVNFVLGAGLHSYGFGGGGLHWVASIVGIDFLFVTFCVLMRMRYNRSRRAVRTPSPSVEAARELVS